MKIKNQTIKAYTLKNAIEHDGNATLNPILNSLFNEGLKKQNIKSIIPKIQEILKEVNKLTIENQIQEFRKLESKIGHRKTREGLPDLPNSKKVITRMSPSPSGPLHIGHILTILPNFLYSQKYNGKFHLRIEDTNPGKIYKPAYKMIEEEIKWLCKNKVKISIQSNNMGVYYKTAKDLINKNSAYICTCNPEEFKNFLNTRKPCPCRNLSKKEQLERWNNMLDKNGYKQGEAVLRFKSNLKDKNPAMRDFPLARINISSHPLQKQKYKVWPLMNLAVTTDDINQNITHVIRGKDHKDNAKRQKMIYKSLGKSKNYPWTAFIGRLHLKGLTLSSSKIKEAIDKGIYKDWDDPKLPTLSSLKKLGYKPETFWKFGEERGISETDKTLTDKDIFEILDNYQKKSKNNAKRL